MNQKPYKENKSSLRQFLDKRNFVEPVPKDSAIAIPGMNEFRKRLDKIYLEGTEEDKARLDVIGWTPFSRPSKKMDFHNYRRFKELCEEDKWRTVNSNHSWFVSGRIFAKTMQRTAEKEKYFVAGKGYESRSAFLFSRTGLGKELL